MVVMVVVIVMLVVVVVVVVMVVVMVMLVMVVVVVVVISIECTHAQANIYLFEAQTSESQARQDTWCREHCQMLHCTTIPELPGKQTQICSYLDSAPHPEEGQHHSLHILCVFDSM